MCSLFPQKRDQQLKEKDEAAGDGNYVTVDAVGFDDDMEFGADFLEMELGTGDGSPVSYPKITALYSQLLDKLF